jgi:hypothetical protein
MRRSRICGPCRYARGSPCYRPWYSWPYSECLQPEGLLGDTVFCPRQWREFMRSHNIVLDEVSA